MNIDTGRFAFYDGTAATGMNEIPVDEQHIEQFERLSANLRAADQGIPKEDALAQAKDELARLREERERRERRRRR